MSGAVSYYAGLSAEDQVAKDYARRGYRLRGNRWRGAAGEIDLIAQDRDGLVFVEVKKSRDFARAAEQLGARQMRRIYNTASEFLAQEPLGQDSPARFDVALVNDAGEIEIIKNAFGH